MPADKNINRKIILNSRPIGVPTDDNFRLEETPTPDTAHQTDQNAGFHHL